MPKKSNNSQILLPARMTICPEAFQNLAVAVLDMPYRTALQDFLNTAKDTLNRSLTPPYTLLNSAIVGCAPTVTHGFEGKGTDRRMMAVGKPLYDSTGQVIGSDFQYPSENVIAQIIRAWIYQWGRSPRFKHLIENQLEIIWNELLEATLEQPDTQWREIPAGSLIRNLSIERGLAFNAIPSLIATLLHEQESFIGDSQMPIRWRRSQDDKEKFCVVSHPIPTSFVREPDFRGEEKEAKEIQDFFAYKLVFRVQTQTGREQPWIYVFLHCQRYARSPLTSNKRGNDITILSALNVERLDGCDRDSTLVRLKARQAPKGKYAGWRDDLPELLEQINARPLVTPSDVFSDPQSFWQSKSAQELQDEYYVIHTEGYKYSPNKHAVNHAVKTGFGLAERSNVINQVCCNLLSDFLESSEALEPDLLTLSNKQCPLALKSFSDLAKRPSLILPEKARKLGLSEEERQLQRTKEHKSQRQERQSIVYKALERATDGLPLRIVILYRNEDTCIAVRQQIREGLLLNEKENLPSNIVVEEHLTTDELLQPLNSGALSPETFLKKWSEWPENFLRDWRKQIKKSHREKMKKWRSYLQSVTSEQVLGSTGQQTLAIIELKKHKAGVSFHDDQNIKGAVREACAREEILSQMILPIKLKRSEESSEVNLRREDKGRVQNTVLDITTRQTGILYGSVPEVYKAIGLSEDIAQRLDVIAFVLKKIRSKPQAYYGLAVRLRANGKVDVRLPNSEDWIPYYKANWQVGQRFAEARKHRPNIKVHLSVSELVNFAEDTLTNNLSAPSVALIRAEVWRNVRRRDSGGWPQLRVTDMAERLNVLEFGSSPHTLIRYERDNPKLDNLLAVIRMRDREEAPQYVTNRQSWNSDSITSDLKQLSGFVEFTEQNIFHYFSVGRLPLTVRKGQEVQSKEDAYKREDGGDIAFKHQQMIEMLPFFVHRNFQSRAGLETLCRIPHYLRSSPAWGVGNLLLPYPMHLGLKLIEDHVCILPGQD